MKNKQKKKKLLKFEWQLTTRRDVRRLVRIENGWRFQFKRKEK